MGVLGAAAAPAEDGMVARVQSAMRSVQSKDRSCPMEELTVPEVSAARLVKAAATAIIYRRIVAEEKDCGGGGGS